MSQQVEGAERLLGAGGQPRAGHHEHRQHHAGNTQQQERNILTDPRLLRVLVVDSKGSSRTAVCSLLRDCEYQVRRAA